MKENTEMQVKIAVAGTGYVGLSIATLLSQYHQVTAVDVVPEKVELINQRKSPIQDEYIEKYLREKPLQLHATTDADSAYRDADFVVIATPTNYDPVRNYFDTVHVEEVIERVLQVNPNAIMVIKSTVPVGYTEGVRRRYDCNNFLFAPNFCAKVRHFTITYIQVASSLAVLKTKFSMKRPTSLRHFCKKGLSKRTSIRFIWGLQRLKP